MIFKLPVEIVRAWFSQAKQVDAPRRALIGFALRRRFVVAAAIVVMSASFAAARRPQVVEQIAVSRGQIETPGAGHDMPAEIASTAQLTYRFLGVDGKALPFNNDRELMEFLLTAEVVSSEDIGRGVTKPKKLLLERDGIRAHAVFRTPNILRKGEEGPPTLPKSALYFKDHYSYEVAAYHLSNLLGFHRVPPAVERKIERKRGSVQIWLEETILNIDRRDRGLMPPNRRRWDQQEQIKFLFDAIIGNLDRNLGNLLIDRSWTSWLIDHTRCFPFVDEPLKPELVTHCERSIWQAIKDLDSKTLRDEMRPYLKAGERSHLVARFEFMVEHMHSLVAEHGEDLVLFDLLPPDALVENWDEASKEAGE